jgi:hypothetical protein
MAPNAHRGSVQYTWWTPGIQNPVPLNPLFLNPLSSTLLHTIMLPSTLFMMLPSILYPLVCTSINPSPRSVYFNRVSLNHASLDRVSLNRVFLNLVSLDPVFFVNSPLGPFPSLPASLNLISLILYLPSLHLP